MQDAHGRRHVHRAEQVLGRHVAHPEGGSTRPHPSVHAIGIAYLYPAKNTRRVLRSELVGVVVHEQVGSEACDLQLCVLRCCGLHLEVGTTIPEREL